MLSITLEFLRRSWRWLVVFQVLSGLVWLCSQGVTSESQVRHRAGNFRQALADGRSVKAWHMVSTTYEDQWGLNRDQIGSALRDITRQFLSLQVEWIDPQVSAGPDATVIYTATMRLNGRSLTPVGEMMLSLTRQLDQPFSFHWKKEGWWPWTWRLVNITNPALELPDGYRPGMFSETPLVVE
jgi:hypothetical protein